MARFLPRAGHPKAHARPGLDRHGASPDLDQGRALHRIGHPRDDAAGDRGTARSTWPRAFPTSRPGRAQGGGRRAIDDDINQYAITWGAPAPARGDRREDAAALLGLGVDPETEITVTCGATEAMIAALLALVDPGDEVIVFEPFYENYGPDAILAGAEPRYVPLRRPDWRFDPDELRAAFGPRTRAIIVNTPHNPTGKVFTRAELEQIAALCHECDAVAITDEIYEHILYDGRARPAGDPARDGRADGHDQRRCRRPTR